MPNMDEAPHRSAVSEATSPLGEGWPIDADGYPHRQAARIVLFDPKGRILLARGHDAAQPGRSWWFTIGGGLEAGESPREGAVRELAEETGLRLDPSQLEGPVLYREALFNFLTVDARQDEWFFIARLSYADPTLDSAAWTELERQVIDEQKWWDLGDLEAERSKIEIFPRALIEMAGEWQRGWDGQTLRVQEFGPTG